MKKEFIDERLIVLKNLVLNIEYNSLVDLCNYVLNDYDFIKCTGARNRHHAYEGGLLVHTAEVASIAWQMAQSNCLKVNTDILITAAIWHDYGKIWDYTIKEGKYEYTNHQDKIRHLARSYAEFMKQVVDIDLPTEIIDDICHCILSHHGRQEWGSPVEPITTEAYILHFSDMLSCKCSLDNY